MRRITTGLLLTVSALVLLFSYHTSTEGTSTVASAAGAASIVAGSQTAPSVPESSRVAAAPPGPPDPRSIPSTTRTTAPTNLQIDGAVEETRRGPVQVRVTFQGARILEVNAIVLPTGSQRDAAINDYAVPILQDESVAAQSANIDMVSGATLTSEGYRASLQSAIDLARGKR